MSEHLPLRSSVGSRGSAPSSHHLHLPPHPRPHGVPDPLASVWIRRLHLNPNPPPPRPSPPLQNAVHGRSAGFGPFRWSPRPVRDAPVSGWDVASSGGGSGPPMLSPFFRFPPPPPPPLPAVSDVGEFAPVRPTIGFGSSSSSSGNGGFPGSSSRTIVGGDSHDAWLATRAAGSAYPSHAVDMVPVRMSHKAEAKKALQHGSRRLRVVATEAFNRANGWAPINQRLTDLHVRQHSMIPQNSARRAPSSSSMIPQNFAGRAPSSSSQQDEPFSYWNMGRFQRSTTTSSISQIAITPSNFVKKRNADSDNLLPMKFRKLSGAG